MLRIDCTTTPAVITLELAGRLSGQWVGELRESFDRAAVLGVEIRIDLDAVDFADREGVELLRSIRTRGGRLFHCSRFLETLLEENRNATDASI